MSGAGRGAGGGGGTQEMREEWGDEGGAGDRGRGDLSTLTKLNIWLPHVPKSPLKPTIPEVLEKSLYYLYLSISIGLDR